MSKETLKIAFISDLHYALQPDDDCPEIGDLRQAAPPKEGCWPERRGEFIPSLLPALIKKFNREIKPDLVLVGGDLINLPQSAEAERLTSILADTLSLLDMPYMVIRGNHDIEQERFVKYFPFKPFIDVDFVRIVAFDDEETPGYNAVRSAEDLQRMRDLADFDGIKFSFQHTPLMPQDRCVYYYNNADEILDLMTKCNYTGTLSGHFHNGIKPCRENGLQYFVQSALCEVPFNASVLHVSRQGIEKVDYLVQ